MGGNEAQAPRGRDFRHDVEAAAPLVWLCASMILSLRGLWQGWRTSLVSGLPEGVGGYLYAGMAAGIVNILLGLYVLGLAWGRSPRLPAWFTLWGGLLIAADLGLQVATLVIPAFVQTPATWLYSAAVVVATLWTIRLARRDASAPPPAPSRPAGPAPGGVVLLNGALGFVLGGAAGAGIGLLAGSVIVDWLDVSCFEGGCGYAAVAIGLLGLIAGAIGGALFAVLRTIGRRPS